MGESVSLKISHDELLLTTVFLPETSPMMLAIRRLTQTQKKKDSNDKNE